MSLVQAELSTACQHGAMEVSTPPTDLDEVRMYRLGRVRDRLKRTDSAGALLYDPLNSRYATDATHMRVWCPHNETRCVFVLTETGNELLTPYPLDLV